MSKKKKGTPDNSKEKPVDLWILENKLESEADNTLKFYSLIFFSVTY